MNAQKLTNFYPFFMNILYKKCKKCKVGLSFCSNNFDNCYYKEKVKKKKQTNFKDYKWS